MTVYYILNRTLNLVVRGDDGMPLKFFDRGAAETALKELRQDRVADLCIYDVTPATRHNVRA